MPRRLPPAPCALALARSPRSKAAASYRQSNGSAGQGSDLGSGSEEAGADSGSEAGLGGGSDAGSGGAAPQRLLVRLLVPQPLCGVIIGKNGATIRQYAADTRTVIRVTSGEAAQVGALPTLTADAVW